MEKTEKAKKIEADLGKKGLNPWLYATFLLSANEQVVGELDNYEGVSTAEFFDGRAVRLLNPKRFVRVQQMTAGGMSIMLVLGDYDLLTAEDSHIWIKPIAGFRWADQSPKSYEALVSNLQEYHDRQVMNRAIEAGLSVDTRPVRPE